MKIALSRADTLFSLGVRAVTRDVGYDIANGFSHTAIIYGDNLVLDSRAAAHGIVAPRPLSSFLSSHSDSVIVNVNLPFEAAAVEFALAQVGKNYDVSALYAFLAPEWMTGRRNWQEDDEWFCSEYAATVLKVGGFKLDLPPNLVSPNHLARALGVPRCNLAGMSCPAL